jgi:hypothetical protein
LHSGKSRPLDADDIALPGDGWFLNRDDLRSVAACQFGLVSSLHEFGLRGSRPNSTWPPHLERRSRRIGSRSRACATSAECLCARIGPWSSPARSKRSRSRTPLLLIGENSGATYAAANCLRSRSTAWTPTVRDPLLRTHRGASSRSTDQWPEALRHHGAPSACGHTESKTNWLHSGRNQATVLRFSQWHPSLKTMAKTIAAKTYGA